MALPTNIRLGWKGLPGINALAYIGWCHIFILSPWADDLLYDQGNLQLKGKGLIHLASLLRWFLL